MHKTDRENICSPSKGIFLYVGPAVDKREQIRKHLESKSLDGRVVKLEDDIYQIKNMLSEILNRIKQ